MEPVIQINTQNPKELVFKYGDAVRHIYHP
jgi:hypothetical protein